ncbi:MAG: YfhO family protein [Flavobacteriales bacterium]
MNAKNSLLTFLCIVGFIILPLLYFSPLLQNQKVLQPDIVHFSGGAQELKDFRTDTGTESYWINSMFSGMPTYQFGARYEYDLITYIDKAFNFLPRPASYIFIMLLSFFILLKVLSIDWKTAALGAVFFAFSTYFFIIIAAGHNAKLHALAYFPGTVAGVLLIYRKKVLLGTIFTILFMALQIKANHFQMTYYMGFILMVYGLTEIIYAIKNKTLLDCIKASLLAIFSLFIGLGINSNRILATYEYAQHSTRGPSELVKNKTSDATDSGMNKNEITAWSYGIGETLNLFLPNLYGGSSSETLNYQGQPITSSYWGEQPFTSGPAYQGAVVIFLFVLGLFTIHTRYKWWLLASTLLSIFLAWGHNFSFLTDFMIDYFPLYSKFRAITSVLVISEFCTPILAAMTVWNFIQNPSETNLKKLYFITAIFGVFLIGILLFGKDLFALMSTQESASSLPQNIISEIKQQRYNLIRDDVINAFFYILITAGALFLSQKRNLYFPTKTTVLTFVILAVGLFDLWSTNKNYLNHNHLVDAYYMEHSYPTNLTKKMQHDIQQSPMLTTLTGRQMENIIINKSLKDLKEKDTSRYRVLNLLLNPMNETHTSYFHHSIGGYHAVKIRRYQDLFDHYISQGNPQVLNMLNTRYILQQNPEASSLENLVKIQHNLDANGNSWLINEIKVVSSADEELEALEKIDTKKQAIIHEADQKFITAKRYNKSSHDTIQLKHYASNHLVYDFTSNKPQFAVFSDVEYPGWQAYINGNKAPHIRVNYLLRGLEIPAGNHTIEFKFEPSIIQTGKWVSLIFYGVFLILIVVIFIADKKKQIR